MNARADAHALLGGRYEVRVLEPSPPAVAEQPWFADDPVARGDVPAGRRLVSPVTTGDVTWDELARQDPEIAAWCADRWLGAWRRLPPAPASLPVTRVALHRLAEQILSRARQHANGRIALRYTHGGFGTPFFGEDVQLRVRGVDLIVQASADARHAPITTLAAAADAIGRQLLPDDLVLDDEPLDVDPAASAFLGDWYGFGASILEQLRAEVPPQLDPSRVQLWPEHFDLAVEIGAEAAGRRAAYGASPGDELHPEPYLYVAPWTAPPPGELWSATTFEGAELPFAALREAGDQRAAALEFLRTRLTALTS